jgi:quinol monooxygenase YgiN
MIDQSAEFFLSVNLYFHKIIKENLNNIMKQLTLAIKFTATTENREQFKQTLKDLFHTISSEKNFINATISEGLQNPNEFFVYETWNDNIEDFLNTQMKRPYVVAFEKSLELMSVKREPAAYTPLAHFGTHSINS